MPSDPRPGIEPYYWAMEKELRRRLNDRCRETGRSMKDELTEALLAWLDTPPSLSERAKRSKRVKAKRV